MTLAVVFAAAGNFGESYILEIVGLVLAGVVVWRKVVPPIRNAMANKRGAIGAQLAAGDEARKATEELLSERRAQLAKAKDDAIAIVSQARHGAEQLVEDGKRRSAAEYERIVSHAATQIEMENNRMRAEIMSEMSDLVIEGAHRVVDIELDAPHHRHLIDESIGAVESGVGA